MSTAMEKSAPIPEFGQLDLMPINPRNQTFPTGYNKSDAATYLRIMAVPQDGVIISTERSVIMYMAYEPEVLVGVKSKMDNLKPQTKFLQWPWNFDQEGKWKENPHLTTEGLQQHRQLMVHVAQSSPAPQPATLQPPTRIDSPPRRYKRSKTTGESIFDQDVPKGAETSMVPPKSFVKRYDPRTAVNPAGVLLEVMTKLDNEKMRASDLQLLVTTWQQKCAGAEQRCESLQAESTEKTAEVQTLEQSRDDLRAEVAQLTERVQILDSEKITANTAREDAESQARASAHRCDELEERLRTLGDGTVTADADITQLRQQISALEEQKRLLSVADSSKTTQVNTLQQELHEEKNNVTSLKTQRGDLEKSLNNVEQQLDQNKHKLRRCVQHGVAIMDQYMANLYQHLRSLTEPEDRAWRYCISSVEQSHTMILGCFKSWVESGRPMDGSLPEIDGIPDIID